jgi:hypothetical protein
MTILTAILRLWEGGRGVTALRRRRHTMILFAVYTPTPIIVACAFSLCHTAPR